MDKRIWRSILLMALLLVGISQARADNHQVVIGTYEHGSVSASPAQNIAPGTQVTLTVKLDDGYIVNELKAYRKTQTGSGQAPRRVEGIDIGEEIPLTTVTANSVYRLVMPDDDVEIVAEFHQALLPADPTQPVSQSNPILIYNVRDMVTLSQVVRANVAWTKNAYFKVAEANAVFDFEGVEGFEPIGRYVNNVNPAFSSSFDGNGVTIKNLHVTGTNSYTGLFGYVRAASSGTHRIENIRIDKSCSFISTANSVGAVVGTVLNTAISNCHNDGASVSGVQYVGGIIGYTSAVEVSGCSSNGNVSGRTMVGGLIGYCYSNTVLNNNSVGMSLSKDEQLTVSITQNNNEVGAVVGTYTSNLSGSDNWYNGMAVVAKMVGTEYKGHGYGAALNDNNFIKSATAGYFPAVTGHNAKGLTWNYDLYEKVFTFTGKPDAGYKLVGVTVTYLDADGNIQSVTLKEEQLLEPWTFSLPSHPTGVSGTYEAALRLLDPMQANSKDNPYLIYTVQDMIALSDAVNASVVWTHRAYFKVAEANAVFDFEGIENFTPIGVDPNHQFSASFDGNGVIIRNLHVTGSNYVGLFGCFNLGGRSLENIIIDKNCSFTGTGGNVGSLAGISTIARNCHNLGAPVTAGGSIVGGLIGYSYNSIIDCSSNANVSGLRYVGGLVGYMGKDTGSRSFANNTVGMDLAQDEHITISSTNSAMGAVAGYCQNTQGSENYYNGMNVTVKYGNREYTGHGYGLMLNDNDYIKSATGGYFPVSIGHSKKGLTWSYDLYEKTFTVVGSPDIGYELTSVTVTYLDADGNSQTISRSEEQLQESWTFEVPAFPRAVSATYKTAFALLDPTQANSKDNPYLIYTVQDMVALSQVVKAKPAWVVGAWFKVAEANAVFDFEGIEGFEPIGGPSNTFQGGFDGNGVTIKNLNVKGSGYIGLIGYVYRTNAQRFEIRGITIDKSCSFTGTGLCVGSVVGAGGGINIFDCHNAGAPVVSSNRYVGGIIGRFVGDGLIDGCSSNANVSGSSYVGGIVGEVYNNGVITNNTVGMSLAKDERIIVSSNNNMFGAIVGNYEKTNGSENYYNGMTVVGMYGNKEYMGHGYGIRLIDNDYVKSATGGYFSAVTGHNAKGLTWSYDFYEKVFTFAGEADSGYELTSVNVTYFDADGNSQTITLSEEQLEVRTLNLPSHPTAVSGTYVKSLKLLNESLANSKDNPYLITNVQDMVKLSQAVNASVAWTQNAWFKVAEANAVFDFEGIEGFEPIGSYQIQFQSSFDGNGVTIRNLHMTGVNYVGLFGWVNARSHRLENITIDKSCSFTGTGSYIGALAGGCTTIVSNCHNDGAPVSSNSTYTGGLVGYSRNSTISYCSSNANVSALSNVGGLVGYLESGNFDHNTVGMGLAQDEQITISSNNNIFGAIAGYGRSYNGSENCYNGMTVVGMYGNQPYTGHGYGVQLTDNTIIKSATGGYCGVANVNSGRNVEWAYDLYTKTMIVKGSGATADYSTNLAPDLIKDDIESLVISEGVTGIGVRAFSGWTRLNSLTFDGCQLTSAASDALEGCTSMAEGMVMVNKRAPFAENVGNYFLSVVTNGVLISEEQLDLSGEVSRVGSEVQWKGGTFSEYRRERIIQGVTFNESRHWATFYTDQSLSKPIGMNVYVVSQLDGDEVSVAEIGYIPANVGVLLYSDKPRNGFNTSIYTGYEESFVSLLRGSLTEQTLANESGYVLYQDEFVLTTGGVLPANRCYLPVPEGGSAAPRLGITLSEELRMKNEEFATATGWYTLNGVRLDHRPTSKGLYIYRGRKVVIK